MVAAAFLGAAPSLAGTEVGIFSDNFETGTTVAWDAPRFCDPVATFMLTQSTAAFDVWSVPAARKVQATDEAPAETSDRIRLFAARREFEPLVVALKSAGPDTVTLDGVSLAPFAELGTDPTIDIRLAGSSAGWPEALPPFAPPLALASGGAARTLWITLFVPADAVPGLHTSILTLDLSGQPDVVIPVELYVFDAVLPAAASFQSLLYTSMVTGADAKKQLLFDHRLTPSRPTAPGSFGYGVTWDQSAHLENRCTTFDDGTDHDSPQFAIGDLARKWILGDGWNGVGFPSALLFEWVDNSTPRPATFCGIDREAGSTDPTHFGSAAYNAEWSDFLAALEEYLGENGLLEKTYYYVQNEPASQTHYDLAAHLCRLTKAAAPSLRIAISEEPKPAIAEHAAGACGYDLWLAHIGDYQEDYGTARQLLGEEVWLYSLDQDFFVNPTLVARQGMDVRMLPWIAWSYGARGWGYYAGDSFLPGGERSVRFELLREGFEDADYLFLANGELPAQQGELGAGDLVARSAAHDFIDWGRDPDAHAALRCELGRYLEGHRASPPALSREGSRPRGSYYLNFQNPLGHPLQNPLVVDGHTWTKIGWDAWDDELGHGWTGQFVGNTGVMLYGYNGAAAGSNDVERSYVYDDFGRPNLFEFDLENGRYLVTVGVGRAGLSGIDPHNLSVEGIELVDDVLPSGTLVESTEVELTDGRLSFVVGGKSESLGDWAYTFLAFIKIEPAGP